MNGRRIKPDVKYNNQSISLDIEPFITDISFTDNLSGQADDISISLGDRERKWMNSWAPKKGASLEVSLLISADWGSTKSSKRKLGQFDIDQVSTSGPPNKVSIKGTSIPQGSTLKGQKKSRSWEKSNLKKVAKDIATKNGMKLYFSSEENPDYDRIEQERETDLSFLMRICADAGLSLKVANKTITILDDAKLEKAAVKDTIKRTDFRIEDYNGNDNLSGTYKACKVSYKLPKTKKTLSYTFTPTNPPKTSRVLYINEEVTSEAAAKRLARTKLREANKEATTFSLKLAGFCHYYAGETLKLKDFGTFDGKYIITSIGGSIGNSSQTSIDLRKCLEGY